MDDNLNTKDAKTIGIIELHNIDHETGKDMFIDVRKKEEWDEGHIEWFTHIPLHEIKNHLDEFKKHERVFFICQSGGRSSMASEILSEADVWNAYNVDGGIEEWKELGFPIVSPKV